MYTLTVKYMNLPLPNFLPTSCIWGEEREKGRGRRGGRGEGRGRDGGKGQGDVVKTYLYIIQIRAGKGHSVLE